MKNSEISEVCIIYLTPSITSDKVFLLPILLMVPPIFQPNSWYLHQLPTRPASAPQMIRKDSLLELLLNLLQIGKRRKRMAHVKVEISALL